MKHMRGINYRSLLSNWDAIIDKLCEECSVHDVLSIIQQNLKKDAKRLESLSICPKKILEAIDKVGEAMVLLNPERE
jgi:gamma-glutamyl-gamma-aminobutyrate hydrolase PuuD